MSKVIKIFDPKEKPFGWLSNNYRHFMRLEGKDWQTVTNYIYANILRTPMFVQQVRLTKNTKEIKSTFHRLYQKEIDNITKQAIETALKVKFENKDLAEKLLATGNSPIFYVSQNKLLGIGDKNDGQNLYGMYLMQMRHLLRVSFKKQKNDLKKIEYDQNIYDTYLAEMGLMEAIRKGNDLKEFLNKTPSEIIEMLGRVNLENKAPRRDFILELAHKKYLNKEVLQAIDYPDTLVISIRKKEMRNLRLRKITERKDIIFNMYADYLLEKHFPELDADQYTKAKEQQLGQMGWQQKNDLENRLYDLFEKGMLSSRLSDAIDERLAHHYIPSEDDVEEAERVPIYYEEKPVEVEAPYIPEQGSPILVYHSDYPELDLKYKDYIVFSPISFTGMLNIDGKNFPTVSHYITARLIAHIPSEKGGGGFGDMNKAYKQLLSDPESPILGIQSFLSPDSLSLRYFKLRDISYQQNLRKYAKKGMDKKFEDRMLQDILLMSGNKTIIYNDFSDPILGVGGKQDNGWNFVGKYLMELRTKYRKLRKNEKLKQLHTVHISYILNEDPFMKEWLEMRVRDMCKVLTVMKNYLYTKDEIDLNINVAFTTAVLDKIYQPCSQLFGAVNLITAEVPQYFSFMVQKCPGFNNVGHNIIEVIWKRIAVIIYYLIQYIEESNIQNLRAILARIEMLVAKGGKCIEIINNEYDNCIVSALLNLLRGIVEFNKQFAYSTEITEYDVKIAASIILNTDVTDEIKPILNLITSDDKPDGINAPDLDIWAAPQGGQYISDDTPEQDWVFPDDDDSDIEVDYGEDLGDQEEDGNYYSPHRNLLVAVLKEIEEVKDSIELASVIEGAVETIKTYPMSKQVKRNRINFFATQR